MRAIRTTKINELHCYVAINLDKTQPQNSQVKIMKHIDETFNADQPILAKRGRTTRC